jgi:hypothetical protein
MMSETALASRQQAVKEDVMYRRNFIAGVGGGLALTAAPAWANCGSTCDIARWQATREPYRGPVDGRRAFACARLLASTDYAWMTEVVLVGGRSAEDGPQLTSLGRGNGHAFRVPNQPAGTQDVYVREFCFDPVLIRGWDAITFCNGFNRGDGNHHTLEGQWLANLKRTGHVGDFLSLLGEERSYSQPVADFFTARLYRNLYDLDDGTWLGT